MEFTTNIFATWQFNLVMFLIFSVLFSQFYKSAVKNTQREGTATILLQLIAGTSVLIFVPFFPIQFPSDYKVYLLLL